MLVTGIPLLLTLLVVAAFVFSFAGSPGLHGTAHLRWQRAGVFGGIGIILLAFLSLLLLPWLVRPQPAAGALNFLPAIPADESGPYLQTTQGFLALPAHQTPYPEPPTGTPVLSAELLQAIIINQKQLNAAGAYQLFELDSGALVSWLRSTPDPQGLRLLAPILTPGAYMLAVPGGGMYGDTTFHFFVLEEVSALQSQRTR